MKSDNIPDQVYINSRNEDCPVMYHVPKLIEIMEDYPIETILVKTLEYQILHIPMWRYPEILSGKPITIHDVLNDPKKYSYHYNRMLNADYTYPIIIMPNGDIADGNHRVGHAMIDKKSTIPTKKIHNWIEIKLALYEENKNEVLSKIL